MLHRFDVHNSHWQPKQLFLDSDPHLSRLRLQSLQHKYQFEDEFPAWGPGIFLLMGGRQLGKSTCLKKLVVRALDEGFPCRHVFYLPCDMILDRTEFYQVLKSFLAGIAHKPGLLLIDHLLAFLSGSPGRCDY